MSRFKETLRKYLLLLKEDLKSKRFEVSRQIKFYTNKAALLIRGNRFPPVKTKKMSHNARRVSVPAAVWVAAIYSYRKR